MSESLLSAHQGPTLVLTLNRPLRRNALTVEMADALTAALVAADRDPDIRAIVLTGSAGHFCSGLDLQVALEHADPSPEGRAMLVSRTLVGALHPALLALSRCSKPTIGALSGATVGFGLSLALACDLRLMGEDAYLSTQFVARGLFPDGALMYQLERICGLGRALDLALRPDRRLTAIEAQSFGLSSRTVAAEGLLPDALALAHEVLRGAPLAQQHMKRLARGEGLAAALATEVPAVVTCLQSEDATEGAMAFFEKRPPTFHGR